MIIPIAAVEEVDKEWLDEEQCLGLHKMLVWVLSSKHIAAK
jgi:hypothetical protein